MSDCDKTRKSKTSSDQNGDRIWHDFRGSLCVRIGGQRKIQTPGQRAAIGPIIKMNWIWIPLSKAPKAVCTEAIIHSHHSHPGGGGKLDLDTDPVFTGGVSGVGVQLWESRNKEAVVSTGHEAAAGRQPVTGLHSDVGGSGSCAPRPEGTTIC